MIDEYFHELRVFDTDIDFCEVLSELFDMKNFSQ